MGYWHQRPSAERLGPCRHLQLSWHERLFTAVSALGPAPTRCKCLNRGKSQNSSPAEPCDLLRKTQPPGRKLLTMGINDPTAGLLPPHYLFRAGADRMWTMPPLSPRWSPDSLKTQFVKLCFSLQCSDGFGLGISEIKIFFFNKLSGCLPHPAG